MKMELGIRKTHGIDTLVSRYSTQKVEEESDLITEGVFPPNLMSDYIHHLEDSQRILSRRVFVGREGEYKLTPVQINAFLSASERYSSQYAGFGVFNFVTSTFLCSLIQDSYWEGNNGFHLNLLESVDPHGVPFQYLFHLKGRSNHPIKIFLEGTPGSGCGFNVEHVHLEVNGDVTVNFGRSASRSSFIVKGDAGYLAGSTSEDIEMTIKGNAGGEYGTLSLNSTFRAGNVGGLCGKKARNCRYFLHGVEENCGQDVRKCEFTVKGDAGDNFGWGVDSIFTVHGNVGERCGSEARFCTFRTSDKKTFKKMIESVPSGNKVILLDRKGGVKAVRRYGERDVVGV